ncbi:hypothetical protein [Paraburkholderia sp. SIMBA_027]|uniref:hypothetical protein n=1 Tax=Paraburkholderia sp. SIMBA_027 TaxID=3085770 RepID=UPI00397D5072
MSVRAKLQLQEITAQHWSPTSKKLVFRAAYDTSIPEDQRFQSATPWAEFTTLIDNPAALAKFEIGKHYYVDFTSAE